jgi:chemotaxis protein CheX
MNSIAAPFNLTEEIGKIVPNVFETMLALPATAGPGGELTKTARISGTVGVAGETVTGAIYLHLPEALAQQAARLILGMPENEIAGAAGVNDIVGELTNMIAGGLKSSLCDADRDCAMSTPSIIRGIFGIEVPKDLRVEIFYFNCGEHRLAVEVHIKLD